MTTQNWRQLNCCCCYGQLSFSKDLSPSCCWCIWIMQFSTKIPHGRLHGHPRRLQRQKFNCFCFTNLQLFFVFYSSLCICPFKCAFCQIRNKIWNLAFDFFSSSSPASAVLRSTSSAISLYQGMKTKLVTKCTNLFILCVFIYFFFKLLHIKLRGCI